MDTLEFSARHHLIFKIFGFAPITIVNYKSVTKPIDFLLFLLAISGGFVACFCTIYYRDQLGTSNSKIADYGNFVMMNAAIVLSTISVFIFFILRHKVWKIVLELAEVQEKVWLSY